MALERTVGGPQLIEVLDRVLDKGIVIDAWVRVSLVGIDLLTIETRVFTASIETYLKYAGAVALVPPVWRPASGVLDLAPNVEVKREPSRPAKPSASSSRRFGALWRPLSRARALKQTVSYTFRVCKHS